MPSGRNRALKEVDNFTLAMFIGCSEHYANLIRTGKKPLPAIYAKAVEKRFGVPCAKTRPDVFLESAADNAPDFNLSDIVKGRL
jgi:DNA-binding transcriptional regulator YdaS (Cro superfamily)